MNSRPFPRILKDRDKGKTAAPGMWQPRDVTLGQGRSKRARKLGFLGAQGGVWVKRNPRMAQAEIPKGPGGRETEEEEGEGCWKWGWGWCKWGNYGISGAGSILKVVLRGKKPQKSTGTVADLG